MMKPKLTEKSEKKFKGKNHINLNQVQNHYLNISFQIHRSYLQI